MKQPGFSLIEILIAVAIIALVATAPRLMIKKPGSDWKSIQAELNTLLTLGRHEAVLSNKPYRLLVRETEIKLQEEIINPDNKKVYFEDVSSPYLETRYQFPNQVHCTGLMAGRKNLFDESDKPSITIYPNGLVDSLELKLEKSSNTGKDKISLISQPFFATFEKKEEEE